MHLSRQALAFLLFNIAVCNEAAEASPEAPVVEEEAAVVYEFKVLSLSLSRLFPRLDAYLSVSWAANRSSELTHPLESASAFQETQSC